MLLIVEDERPLSHALDMKLKNQGYTTKVVTNGQDALKELKSTKYDLVLMDLIMPVMDGFAMLQEMWSIRSMMVSVRPSQGLIPVGGRRRVWSASHSVSLAL
jgi:DNA-binding response OmpR family regulator